MKRAFEKSKKFLISLLTVTLIVTSLTGCASLKTGMIDAMNNNKEVVFSVAEQPSDKVKEQLTWTELDQLNSYKSLRRTWDNELNILKFDNNSKNGVLFVDLDGNWSGNNTLYNAFQNKEFVTKYYEVGSIRSKIAEAAMEQFSDISNESVGILASVNAYFNILVNNEDGTSALSNYITRAEAMAAIYRADTPVILNDVNEEFKAVVGENVYNEYAQNVTDDSYLDYKNGSLNSIGYNSTMTKGEFIYMLVKRYFPSDFESVNTSSCALANCKDGGNIAEKNGFNGHAWQAYVLEYCLQNNVVDSDLYKAFAVAYNRGIISSDFDWKAGLYGGDVINYLINAYTAIHERDDFKVSAKVGSNVGESLYVKEDTTEVVEPEKTEQVIQIQETHKLSDLADIDDLIKAYGTEIEMTDEEIEEAKQVGEQFTIEEYDTYLVVDHCQALNVRTGPSTDYRIIKSVPKGTEAHVVGICAENGWYRVIADGKICYQCGVYFSEK